MEEDKVKRETHVKEAIRLYKESDLVTFEEITEEINKQFKTGYEKKHIVTFIMSAEYN